MNIAPSRDPTPIAPAISHMHAPTENRGVQDNEATASHDEMARMEALMASQLRSPR
jgi:hypothetical protein